MSDCTPLTQSSLEENQSTTPLMYYLNSEHCFSSRYFPTAANEPEVLLIHRKWLNSALKNKVDTLNCIQLIFS